MKVHLSGHHVEITPALRGYVQKKIGRIVTRFDKLIEVHCILTVEKLRHSIVTFATISQTLHADAIDEDMYASIDALADKLERRVRKHKERVGDHHAVEAQKHGYLPAP